MGLRSRSPLVPLALPTGYNPALAPARPPRGSTVPREASGPAAAALAPPERSPRCQDLGAHGRCEHRREHMPRHRLVSRGVGDRCHRGDALLDRRITRARSKQAGSSNASDLTSAGSYVAATSPSHRRNVPQVAATGTASSVTMRVASFPGHLWAIARGRPSPIRSLPLTLAQAEAPPSRVRNGASLLPGSLRRCLASTPTAAVLRVRLDGCARAGPVLSQSDRHRLHLAAEAPRRH